MADMEAVLQKTVDYFGGHIPGCGRFFSEDHCLYRDLYNRKECNRMGRKDGALDAAAYKDADRCGDVYRFDG